MKKWISNAFITRTKNGNALRLKFLVAVPLLFLICGGISYKWFVLKEIDTSDFAILVPSVIALLYRKKSVE